MKFEEIRDRLKGIPFMGADEGKQIYDFIMQEKPLQCLELGFAHGVGSCYMAAALHELGRGHLTTVDVERARGWQKPSIEETIEKAGLASFVTPVRMISGYPWFLKKKIEHQTTNGVCHPFYDFCYIDGCKNWTIDGLTFFLVDKLLNPGGWILFDDYSWIYDQIGRTQSDGIKFSEMSEEELINPHVEAIFRLLVMQHPQYENFKVERNNWAWAKKII